LQDEKIESYAGIPDSVLIREKALKKELAQLNQQLLESPNTPEVKQALFEAKEAFNQHVEATREAYPKYHELKFQSSIPSLSSIQNQLPADLQLVEYMQDDTAYYALLIGKQKAQWFYLGEADAINRQVRNWKEAIIRREEQLLPALASELYKVLWHPLEAYLTRENITIVPYGPLFYLNFETLRDDEGRFLIQRYNLSYALSFNLLLSKEEVESSGLIMAIAPGFEEEIKLRYQQQLDSLEALDKAYLRTVRQPWSRKLAEKLNRQFSSRIYTGLEATESNIKAQLQEGKVLYFGTHAIADPDDPLRSKLVLSKEIGPQQEDGYLHAYELYGIPLEAELAVLNACESGLGSLQAGEGMISLAYSIHYAGCPSTVMSLWKVDEKISTRITETFLSYLQQGLTKSQALRQAKLDYLESADAQLQHPFYWGGMVLMGQDGEVVLQKSTGNYWWILIPGLLLAATGVYLFRKKNHIN
jgi:CHAT domain-containing protein